MKKLLIILLLLPIILFAQVDRSKMPKPGAAPTIKIADYESFELNNGLKVFVIENHKLPVVSFSLVFDRDALKENNASGYISAAGELLRTGTKTRTKDQIDEEIDFIGASLNASSTSVFASSLKKHADTLLTLMSDIVLNAEFTQNQLDKIILRMKSDLAIGKDDPSTIASNVRKVLLYGKDHPYGELATEETIDNITLDKCSEYYKKYFKPNIAYLAVVGDISIDEAKPIIKKYFGSWERGDVPRFIYDIPKSPTGVNVAIVDRPNAVQSVINVCYPVQLKIGDPDDIKAKVTNTILGGGVFRLFNNLREKHSYTYGAYSTLANDRLTGYFNASADVRNEVTDSAVTEIFYEMNRINNEAVPEEELQGVKNYLTGNFVMALESPQTVAGFAINTARYNLPKDYYATYLQKVADVTVPDIKEEAQKYIHADNNYILIVGNADQIKENLSKFGAVQFYDRFGNSIDTSSIDLGVEGVSAEQIIENYITAIGGREKLAAVNDRITEMSGKVQSFDVKMTVYQKVPDLLRQDISAGPMNQEVIFNGSEGVMKASGQEIKITGQELEKLKYEASLGLLLKLDEYGVKVKLTGSSKVDGKDSYQLEMIFPGGTKWIQYYDKETGFKLKDEKNITTAQGTFTQETLFTDYRDVDGLKFPFILKQTLGAQTVEFVISSIKINSGVGSEKFEIK
ncbi:MAG: insulinase family protein [Ignavibacteriaceae bacterium]|nr:insulinase family protein [Ignavibacteriaceae bacterium]